MISSAVLAVSDGIGDVTVQRLRARARSSLNPFHGGVARVPNNPIVKVALSAIYKAGAGLDLNQESWGHGPRPEFRYYGRRGGTVVLRIDGVSDKEAWDVLRGCSAFTADVMLAAFAHLSEPSAARLTMEPAGQALPVDVTNLLASLDIQRYGKERDALAGRIEAELERLSLFRFDIENYPFWDAERDNWNVRGACVAGITLIEYLPLAPTGSHGPGSVPAWCIRFGSWRRLWANNATKAWLTSLPQALLALDHRANRGAELFAKKVGLVCSLAWGNKVAYTILERRIHHLLGSIGELPLYEDRPPHWAGRTRDRLEAALLLLHEQGLVAEVEWDDATRPGEGLRTKGWVQDWLVGKVRLHRPGTRPTRRSA